MYDPRVFRLYTYKTLSFVAAHQPIFLTSSTQALPSTQYQVS